MKLLWTKSAKESYGLLKTDAPDVAEKVKSILKDTATHPETGFGSPTKLERDYSGLWQRMRRIDAKKETRQEECRLEVGKSEQKEGG